MKHYSYIPALLPFVVMVSCMMPYPSDFNRIEEAKLRVIGVTYLPVPEVVPGDTLTARAYFAGNDVVQVDNFTLAHDAFWDQAGMAYSESPLTVIATQSWLPDSFQYTFVIPDSTIVKEYRRFYGMSNVHDSIARLLLQPKDSVEAFITTLPEAEQSDKMEMIKNTVLWSNTIMTAHAENGTSIRVVANFAIRYHARYPEYLSVNHNPEISWMAIFRVPQSSAMGFSPFGDGVSKQYLFNAMHPDSVDTLVTIDTGYSYFVACDNGVRRLDSNGIILNDTLRDSEISSSDEMQWESYTCKWFYQNVEMVSNTMDSLLVIDDHAIGSIAEIKPPLSTRMRHFKMWVVVTDRFDGAFRYRPTGMAIKGVSGAFNYSDAYRK